MNKNRRIIFTLSLILLVFFGMHLWTKRYYFRFIPLPIDLIHLVDKGSYFFPSAQAAIPMGALNFSAGDLRTDEGLRETLNNIQYLSPFSGTNGIPNYKNLTFEKWSKQVQDMPMFCTDGTQLFILAAWKQGLMVREWHLLPPGWPPGQGHSVAEYFNPSKGKWQLVDPQHASIIRGVSGEILSMKDVLKKYIMGEKGQIVVDYGLFHNKMLAGARGPTTESYFFDQKLLDTPVLQLRQATWFAKIKKVFGLSGHFIVGYPIIFGDFNHHPQIIFTKISFLGLLLFGLISFVMLVKSFRCRNLRSR